MRHALPVSVALLAVAAAAQGAPYSAVTSFTGGYVDPPSGATTAIAANQDDTTVAVSLPFRFAFFGRPYDKVSVSENGWLAFGTTTSTSGTPALLSSAEPNAVVAPLWMDLATGANGAVKTFTLGTAPERTFVVAWQRVDTFTGASDDDMSFEVLLHEDTGAVEIAYASGGTWEGLSYGAGIEDATGTLAYGTPAVSNASTARPTLDWRYEPTPVTVTGTVLRDRPVASATGLGPAVAADVPVAGADVEIVREDTGEAVATGTTSDSGAFTVTSLGVDLPATLAVDLLASSSGARVTDASGIVYRRRIASGLAADGTPTIGTVRLTLAIDATDPTFRRALNVQQTAHRGLAWADAAAALAAQGVAPAAAAETFPQLEFRWVPGAAAPGGTSYVPAGQTTGARVNVNDTVANPDPWDDDVVLREVGVHVFATISVLPGAFAHAWTGAQATEGHALADGFSWWFAAAVQGRSSLVDTLSATAATVYDLEAPLPSASGPSAAGAIAASIWDLCDPASESDDDVAGALPESAQDAFAVVDRELDSLPTGTTQFTVRSLFDAWTSTRAADVQRAASRAFIRLGTLPDDAEPNDVAGSQTPFPVGAQRLEARVLNPYNEDRFALNLAGTGDEPLTVAFVQQDQVEVDLEILDGSGAVLATATNSAASDRTKLTVTTAGAAPAGDYVARVAWKAGGTAHYALSFSTTLRLVSTLPPWTAGEPYKQDLVAVGGVPPLSLTVTQSVPGLAVTGSGTRLSGTPTTAGDYVVRVTVTDASGVGSPLSEDLALRVNAPLALPALFGIRADATVDVTLGSGGTSPTWAPGAAPPAGLALTGGGSLRLAGTTGVPRAFSVSGSAADVAGAVLAESAVQVVVCPPLREATGTAVDASAPFGYHFDALAGSGARVEVRFSGTGPTPRLVKLVDDSGAPLDVSGGLDETGRTTRIAGLTLPRTARYYVVFGPAAGFTGSVAQARVRARPPGGGHGVLDVATPSTVRDVTFEAVAGSRLTLAVRSANVPAPAKPGYVVLVGPDGGDVTLPRARVSHHGRRLEIRRASLPLQGAYRLRLGGDSSSKGPLLYEFRVDPPRHPVFDLP